MSKSQYFRAGAGCVIYNDQGQILLFSRADKPEVWQFPQGGMDVGETTEETLWRELEEETGLTNGQIENVTKYPKWTYYEYSAEIRQKMKDPDCLGQTHTWYFLKIKPDVEINLTLASHHEFTSSRWSTFTELLSQLDLLKQAVFSELSDYFTKEII